MEARTRPKTRRVMGPINMVLVDLIANCFIPRKSIDQCVLVDPIGNWFISPKSIDQCVLVDPIGNWFIPRKSMVVVVTD